jgi:transposase
MHENGEVIRNLQIKHTITGFAGMNKARQELGVEAEECVLGLETAHNILADYLWDEGYQCIYVLPPNVIKSSQGRYRQSGAKDDRWDARLIADILRTDQRRYAQWQPDSTLTRQIRAVVRMVGHLSKELVRNSNRLRAVLLRYYPAAVNLFSSLDSMVSLAFIQAYPTPEASKGLGYGEFCEFLRKHHHTQTKKWAHSYSMLTEPYPEAHADVVRAYSPQAVTLAQIIKVLVNSKSEWLKRLTELSVQHPDYPIYASLPGAGDYLEPALLAMLGDDRQRFPSPKVLQAIAGTCPVTEHSGKKHWVHFRFACDHEFRRIVQQWAKLTIEVSPWAEAYYSSVRPQCQNDSDATRRLANRWLEILWRLWQDRSPYDQEYHLKQHMLRCRPK